MWSAACSITIHHPSGAVLFWTPRPCMWRVPLCVGCSMPTVKLREGRKFFFRSEKNAPTFISGISNLLAKLWKINEKFLKNWIKCWLGNYQFSILPGKIQYCYVLHMSPFSTSTCLRNYSENLLVVPLLLIVFLLLSYNFWTNRKKQGFLKAFFENLLFRYA